MNKNITPRAEAHEKTDSAIVSQKQLSFETLHPFFSEKHANHLVPCTLSRDEKTDKKDADFRKWKNNETYTKFNRNSIGMRTGVSGCNVVDVDTKDLSQLIEPWKSWVEDRLMFGDSFIVETFMGYHIYIDLPEDFKLRTTTNTGANKSVVPFIDFRGEGGMIFIAANNVARVSYEVIADDAPTTDIGDIIDLMPKYVDKVEIAVSDDNDIDITDVIRRTCDEVAEILSWLPANTDRTTWMERVAGAYNMIDPRYSGIRIPVLLKWSKTGGKKFTQDGFDKLINELETGTYGKEFKGGTVIEDAMKAKLKRVVAGVEKKTTMSEVNAVWTNPKFTNEPQLLQEEQLTEIATAIQNKQKELDPDTKIIRIDTLRKMLKDLYSDANAAKELRYSNTRLEAMVIVNNGEKYMVADGDSFKMSSKFMVKGNAVKYIAKETGISAKTITEVLDEKSINISEVMYKTVYDQDVRARFVIEPHPTNTLYQPVLMVYVNPLFEEDGTVNGEPLDEEIIDDFANAVWDGKLLDLLKIITLTVKFKDKKNLIGVVAPPNTSKSELPQLLGAPKVKMRPLIRAIDGEKGMGKVFIDQMERTGLLLIDEVSTPIPEQAKDFVTGITLDQFGAGGGTRRVDVRCTVLTSIHTTMFSHADAEIVERALLVRVKSHKHSIKESPVYKKDAERYAAHTKAYVRHMFKQMFLSDSTKDELIELQVKYAVTLKNEDVMESIESDVLKELIAHCKDKTHGFDLNNHNTCMIKTKGSIKELIETVMTNYPQLANVNDKKETLMSKFVNEDEKRVKFNGEKWYRTFINIDEENEDFEDLDLKEL